MDAFLGAVWPLLHALERLLGGGNLTIVNQEVLRVTKKPFYVCYTDDRAARRGKRVRRRAFVGLYVRSGGNKPKIYSGADHDFTMDPAV